MQYLIIETEDGLSVVDGPDDADPQQIALENGGRLVDTGTFDNYEQADEALVAQAWLENADREASPGPVWPFDGAERRPDESA